jgi:hypothetical protein
MKQVLVLLILLIGFAGFAKIQAIPAPPTPEEEAAAQDEFMNAIKSSPAPEINPTGKVVPAAPAPTQKKGIVSTKVKALKPAKPSWSATAILALARATDINHSKILDPENPNRRTESNLAISLEVKYKIDEKNAVSFMQVVEKNIITNPVTESENEMRVKNLSTTYLRSTNMRFLGSDKITIPYILILPTTSDSRKAGTIGSFGIAPSMYWELNPTFNVSLSLYGLFTAKSNVAEEYAFEKVMEQSNLLLSNSVSLGIVLNDMISVYQVLGVTSKSQNYRSLGSSEQIGANLDVTSGISFAFTPKFSLSLSVYQAAPLQGEGFGTKVYESNLFRLYHVAQTSYGMAASYIF